MTFRLSSSRLAACALALASLAGCAPEDGRAPAAEAQHEAVTFGKHRLSAGTRFEIGLLFSLDLETTMRPKDAPATAASRGAMGSITEVVMRDEVLAVDGDEPTRIRATYVKHRASERGEGGRWKEQPSPLEGRVYELARDGSRFTVKRAGGEAVSPEEARDVEEQHRLAIFEADDDAVLALAGRTMHVGERAAPLERALGRMLSLGRGEKPGTEATVTLTAPPDREGLAKLDVGMRVTMDDGPLKITFPLQGTALVTAREGALRKLHLEGPATIEAGGDAAKAMAIGGTGTMTLSLRFRFLEGSRAR